MSQRVYDPRKGEMVETDNPALIARDLMHKTGRYDASADAVISEWADYCEEPVAIGYAVFHLKASSQL